MKTYILGLFDSRADAEPVIDVLNKHNLPETDFGLFGRHEDFREGLNAEDEEQGVAKSAQYGAMAGGAAGVLVGVVAGASFFLIPGVGQVLGAGALAAAIGTAATSTTLGAAGGAFMGALLGYGASEEDANFYIEGLKQGGVLVVAHTPEENVSAIAEIFDQHNVVNVERRREQWAFQGRERWSDT
ncbi:hypothetical protein GC175_18670 [bacterium]|nr:hypothetical protein [bacterium]